MLQLQGVPRVQAHMAPWIMLQNQARVLGENRAGSRHRVPGWAVKESLRENGVHCFVQNSEKERRAHRRTALLVINSSNNRGCCVLAFTNYM